MHLPRATCVVQVQIVVCLGTAHSDATDLISQLLVERLPLFHEKQTESVTSFIHLPYPNHTSSSSPSSPLSLSQRLTNQTGAEGILAYLLDCYDRALNESRQTTKVSSNLLRHTHTPLNSCLVR